MGIHRVKEKFSVYKGEKVSEAKFRIELSKLIIEKYGKEHSPDQKIVREIYSFSLNFYISKFKEICLNETSVRFYQCVFWFHEQATELAILHPHQDLSAEISKNYIASYRRKLKYILEMGCDVQMVTGEEADGKFRRRMEPILNDLLFLGEMIIMCVEMFAEQTMVDDVGEISFDKDDLYVFSRRHHYETIIEHIKKVTGSHLTKTVVDDNGLEDLKKALLNCMGIRYEDVGHLIASIHEQNEEKGGELCGVGWDTLPLNLNRLFNVPLETAEQFFRGLRLDRTNKMDLIDLVCRPYNLNRYLYKPIIIWNIDGNDFALFGKNSFTESIIQYSTNAIPWGKAPEEWMQNECFKTYVHRKEDDHDKWLDDAVEEKLKKQSLQYDRNVKQLKSSKGITNIDVPGLGEVDFIIIAEKVKKIFIADCKHLLGRYDMVNQKNDYNSFAVGSKRNKSYNETMTVKLDWFNKNKVIVQEHFQAKYSNKFSLDDYTFEGIFIVNTPTFYMYNAEYRIYTILQIESVVIGEYTDPTFMVVIEDEKYEKILNVKYPFFKKPTYITYDPFDEEDVDE